MARTVNYVLHRLTDGVTAALSRVEGIALSNAGIVDLGDGTLVFDTSASPGAAADLQSISSHLTGRAPTLAANSHWHLDHLLGNQVFSSLPIWATRRTIEILHERRATLEGELEVERLTKDVAALESQYRGATSKKTKAYLGMVLRINRALLAEAPRLRLTPPNREFGRRKRLGEIHPVELVSFGAGHTESDAILFAPEDRVVFAGDLVAVGQHPNFTSGNPEHWLKVLDGIDRLKPEVIVPGHGPLGNGDATSSMRDYITTLLNLAEQKREAGIPSRFSRWGERGLYEANMAFLRARSRRRRARRRQMG